MLATKQPVLRRFWYAVMPQAHLGDGKPHGFTLLGEKIVLWQRSDGRIACLKDRCCHRSAQLSLGFLEGDHVVCGYHGWTFEGGGRCVRVPQRPASQPIPSSYGVPAYRAEARYGYVWVALDEPLTGIPELPEHGREGWRQIDQFYEPWRIGALRLMENSFDSAHIAFTHRATFGDMSRPESTPAEITPAEYGFVSRVAAPVVVRGDVAHQVVRTDSATSERRIESIWYMPFVRRSAIRYPHGLEHVIITCATPVDDEHAMIVQWAYRNDTEADTPAAQVIAFDRAVTLEDKLILESTDPDVPLAVAEGEELHMGSDRPGLLMRRMLGELLARHGETEQRRVVA
ncbi:MAG: aromatic ring-hydroxylating dioxygenase subunit alpha [Ideonella sp.]|jgi:phenylpropionate dioxygenase-like ring-hydroxylating dioxygenase large terminal subunit|nr:aromatic ring-hydroxylating dioxygenase subunit alpha [Ideonella sp.]